VSLMVAQEVPTSTTMALPHGPAGVAEARRRLRADLSAQDVPEPVVDDAVLILSELLSNSCRHARPLGADQDGRREERLTERLHGRPGVRPPDSSGGSSGSSGGGAVTAGADDDGADAAGGRASGGSTAQAGAQAPVRRLSAVPAPGRPAAVPSPVVPSPVGAAAAPAAGASTGASAGAPASGDREPDRGRGRDGTQDIGSGIRAAWAVGADGLLVLEVTDGGGPTRPRPASPSLTAHGGRGLGIVNGLALRWGVRDAPGEVTVWVVLAVRGRHARRDEAPTGIGLPRGVPLDLPLDLAESLDDLT
jgi:hypothetical protein